MNGIDRLLINSLLRSISNAAEREKMRLPEQCLPEEAEPGFDAKSHAAKKSTFEFENELKNIENDTLRDFIAVERQKDQTWLVIKNRHLIESILKTFADEDKKMILDITREKAESTPRILTRCHIPNTSAYRKINQLINDGFVVPTGMAETFEGKRAILYKSVIQQIQISIDKNDIVAKILIPYEMLDSSTLVQAVIKINQNGERTMAN